jgi:uncharacterized protein
VIKAVLDANVLASGFVARSGSTPPALLLDAWRTREYLLLVSESILDEFARTLTKPYFAARLSPAQVAADVQLLRTDAIVVPLTVQVQGVATHPEDDLVLATAVSGQADYLVTGDHGLQSVGSFQGVTILGPTAFLQQLQTSQP